MLVGRGEELARIEQALAAARLGSSQVLVLAGDPGIGKTALLQHAVATANGMTVLQARGVESEAEIPFAGLYALLRPAFDRLDELPAPQAQALRGALGLAPGAESDRFLIGAATLSLLAALAENGPVLLAIDDAHWVDESSLGAVLFAARRLFADALALLIATRPQLALDLPTLELRGLDRETSGAVLQHHARVPLPPGTADRLYEATLGNPLALVELANAVRDPEHLPETSVEHAFVPRIAGLPSPTRRILALAAAEDSGDLALLERAAAHLGLGLDRLAAAERAHLITLDLDRVTFCHPLARSAAYRAAPADERRTVHRALANADSDPDRQAWHAAAAALGPDDEAAHALEDAGRRARTRGAYTTAASSFERAARLTTDREERARRLSAAAEAAWLGGHSARAEPSLLEARALTSDAALRVEIDHLRGHALLRAGRVVEAHDVLVAAAAHAPRDVAVAMLAEASEACLYAQRSDAMLRAAEHAWGMLSEDAGERARFRAALSLGMALIYTGRGDEGAARLWEANEVLERSEALRSDPRTLTAAALAPLWLREARGRALISRAIESARSAGAVGALPVALWLAARDAGTSDRYAIAVALYEETLRLAHETGQEMSLCSALAGLACVEARQGREEPCRKHAEEALALSRERGIGFFEVWGLDAMTDLELGLGNVEAALGWLTTKHELLEARGIADPDSSPAPELIEALLRLDRSEEARALLPAFAAAATAKGQPWSLARLARVRALLGEAPFAAAYELHARTPDRFEQARTLLCEGEALRRARERVRARQPLRRAIEVFEALGAAPWAERARAELLASGETARRRDPATLDQLTPRELQVALVLADGHTIREAAGKLFLSPKTVDYHLRHVYRKLAIDSRGALAEALKGDKDPHLMRPGPAAPSVHPLTEERTST